MVFSATVLVSPLATGARPEGLVPAGFPKVPWLVKSSNGDRKLCSSSARVAWRTLIQLSTTTCLPNFDEGLRPESRGHSTTRTVDREGRLRKAVAHRCTPPESATQHRWPSRSSRRKSCWKRAEPSRRRLRVLSLDSTLLPASRFGCPRGGAGCPLTVAREPKLFCVLSLPEGGEGGSGASHVARHPRVPFGVCRTSARRRWTARGCNNR